jgi:starvation-inducible outer membrane lipoprotein
MRRIFLVSVCLMAAACTTAPVKLKNPATGQIAQCGPYFLDGAFSDSQAQRERACVNDFQMQGFVRLPD